MARWGGGWGSRFPCCVLLALSWNTNENEKYRFTLYILIVEQSNQLWEGGPTPYSKYLCYCGLPHQVYIISNQKVLLCNTGPQKCEKQKLDNCCRKSSTLPPTCHHTNKLSPYGYHSGHMLLKSILHIAITDLSHVARLRHLAFGQMVKSPPVVLI